MYEILKSFLYSTDGVNSVAYEVGETQPVNDDLSPGLVAEGFIAVPGAEPVAPAKKSKK